jgi:hypothetical protein
MEREASSSSPLVLNRATAVEFGPMHLSATSENLIRRVAINFSMARPVGLIDLPGQSGSSPCWNLVQAIVASTLGNVRER